MEAEGTTPMSCSLPSKESHSNGGESDAQSCKRSSPSSTGTPCFWNILDPRKDFVIIFFRLFSFFFYIPLFVHKYQCFFFVQNVVRENETDDVSVE